MLAPRIPFMEAVPTRVRAVFLAPDPTKCTRTTLFRETAARVVLDALGLTGLTNIREHNTAVSDARNWFKHDRGPRHASEDLFDLAGLNDYPVVREAVLACTPIYLEDPRNEPNKRKPRRTRQRRVDRARATV